MGKYQLSSAAEKDLDHLYSYGVLNFGLDKANAYYDGLIDQLDLLTINPNIGVNCDEMAYNLQRFSYCGHIIFFTKINDIVLI